MTTDGSQPDKVIKFKLPREGFIPETEQEELLHTWTGILATQLRWVNTVIGAVGTLRDATPEILDAVNDCLTQLWEENYDLVGDREPEGEDDGETEKNPA